MKKCLFSWIADMTSVVSAELSPAGAILRCAQSRVSFAPAARKWIAGLNVPPCALLLVLSYAPANAVTLLSDNFDTENGGGGAISYNAFSNFTVSDGTVDLVGNGFSDFLPGNGLYVELGGSTLDSGVLLSKNPIAVGTGHYTMSFDLAGAHQNFGQMTAAVQWVVGGTGTGFDQYKIGDTDPFTTFTRGFTVDCGGPGTCTTLQFEFSMVSEGFITNIGLLLDNVLFVQDRNGNGTPVPEPASLALLGIGLAGLGWSRRKK